jgi:hypothetical protein
MLCYVHTSLLPLQVPLPVREAVYDIVAANRYSWFGRSKVCQVRPAARLRCSLHSKGLAAAALLCCLMLCLRTASAPPTYM